MPQPGLQKTIHQRNKSSPALSTMAQAGGLKAVAKRTAFGDVSNTANLYRPSRDDSVINIKGDSNLIQKPVIPSLQARKSSALLRPAQRPLSVSGLKSLLQSIPGTHNNAPPKEALVEHLPPVQTTDHQVPSKRTLLKRSTAIFKDAVPPQTEQLLNQDPKPPPTVAPLPPAHQDLTTKPQPKRQEMTEEAKECSHRERQSEIIEVSNGSDLEENVAFRSDGVYIDDKGQLRQCYNIGDVETKEREIEPAKNGIVLPARAEQEPRVDDLDRLLDAQLSQPQQETSKPKLAPVSEPEEYWDEGEENYDEEDYVTARSFKSRRDSTTTGATTVLFPKVNQKIRRELAAARELIESTRTAEEIDEETWDTSMVAEYGDEIFQYMRELEVGTTIGLVKRGFAEPLTDKNVTQCPLHGQSGRNSMVNASCPYGLAGSSPSPIRPESRDSFPLRELH